jgi:L-lactate dehydrogenase (cytochrome)
MRHNNRYKACRKFPLRRSASTAREALLFVRARCEPPLWGATDHVRHARPAGTAIDHVVYDVTAFRQAHPGGAELIDHVAGKDGTAAFTSIHPRDLARRVLPKTAVLGDADASTRVETDVAPLPQKTQEQDEGGGSGDKPALDTMLNAFDFEAVAKQVLSDEAWGYYSSGADDEISLRENHAAFHRVWLKPRVLINVAKVDTSTTMGGTRVRGMCGACR